MDGAAPGTLLFPLAAMAGKEKESQTAHVATRLLPCHHDWTRKERRFPSMQSRPAPRPFIERVAGVASPPHLARTTGAPQEEEPPLAGLRDRPEI
jgi:hypothetical protein